MGGMIGKLGSGLSTVGSKIGGAFKPTTDADGDKVPSVLQQALGKGLMKGSQTYQQQQDALARRPGQPAQFQAPDASLPPEFFQQQPVLPPRQQMNPNLFYGG